jgi:hypothetical protein
MSPSSRRLYRSANKFYGFEKERERLKYGTPRVSAWAKDMSTKFLVNPSLCEDGKSALTSMAERGAPISDELEERDPAVLDEMVRNRISLARHAFRVQRAKSPRIDRHKRTRVKTHRSMCQVGSFAVT